MGRVFLGSGLLAAYSLTMFGQQTPAPTAPPSEKPLVFGGGVREVLAPTIVTGRDGSFVEDLRPSDFRLYDNGKLQPAVSVNQTTRPISMVVAIQANTGMAKVLPKLKRMGSMLEQRVLGDNGEAALVAFDHRIRTIQDFTHDGQKFNRALETLGSGSSTSVMIDAVQSSIRMLQKRPAENRKIILLISETRDGGSEAKTREVLTNAEFGSVTVYTISVSRMVTELTGEKVPQRISPIPPAASMGNIPGAAVAPTPLGMEQVRGTPGGGTAMDLAPVIRDIFDGVKKIFVDAPADVFTTYTGGRKFDFYREKGLEEAFIKLSGELHREYVLSYAPNQASEGGYHEIVVQVARPNVEVRTRPGYWYAGDPTAAAQ